MYTMDFLGGQSSIFVEISMISTGSKKSFLYSLGIENEGQEWPLDSVDKVEATLLTGS